MSYFLPLASTFNEKALKNPAIGAFNLSSRKPNLLIVHKISLYAQLKIQAKPPNFDESVKVFNCLLLIN